MPDSAPTKFLPFLLGNTEEEAYNVYVDYIRLVRSIAADYTWSGIDFEDLVHEGIIGLAKAKYSYNPELEVKFSTYASCTIRNSIKSSLENYSSDLDVPQYIRRGLSLLLTLRSHLNKMDPMEVEESEFDFHRIWELSEKLEDEEVKKVRGYVIKLSTRLGINLQELVEKVTGAYINKSVVGMSDIANAYTSFTGNDDIIDQITTNEILSIIREEFSAVDYSIMEMYYKHGYTLRDIEEETNIKASWIYGKIVQLTSKTKKIIRKKHDLIDRQ